MTAVTSLISGVIGGALLVFLLHLTARFAGFDADAFSWPAFFVGWFGSALLIYKA